jgi:hypothetical protein
MVTLDRWRTFLSTPKTLTFPHLELKGRDHAPSIVIGAGEVRMPSLNEFTFALSGMAADVDYASAELNRRRERPYDSLARPRLNGVDADGVEWSCGYTLPWVSTDRACWKLGGEIVSLHTDDHGAVVSQGTGTELMFLLRVGDPMTLAMAGFMHAGEPSGGLHKELKILGSNIRFTYELASSMLLVEASGSPELPHPYAENWLSEPLRILFGQLIYPRLVARNFGGGRAFVSVRRCPDPIRGADWAALWSRHDLSQKDSAQFWSYYEQLLCLIARARGKDGSPNFEAHKLTQLYEECVQAALGSRWVWALTFASSIEALVKMNPRSSKPPTQAELEAIAFRTAAIADLEKHINAWRGEPRLKQAAIDAVRRTENLSTRRALRDLKDAGVITAQHLSAWVDIRNEVMHGNLVSRYSNEEKDAQLLALAAMMHALTRELLRRSSATG